MQSIGPSLRVFLLATAAAPAAAQELEWIPGFHLPGVALTGHSAQVSDLEAFQGANGPELVVCGGFSSAGEERVVGIAAWNGSRWSKLGRGVEGGVYGLAKFDDGQGPALYVHGSFTRAGSVSAPNVARWNGSQWSQVPGLVTSSLERIQGIGTLDDGSGPALYVWGNFTSFYGHPIAHLARWNGTSWQGLGPGPGGPVQAVAIHDDGSGPALHVATRVSGGAELERWSGTSWTALGTVAGTYVLRLASLDEGAGPTLCAAGDFLDPATNARTALIRWTAPTWSSFPIAADTGVYDLRVFDQGSGPRLFAATGTSGGAGRLERWDHGAWTTLGGETGVDLPGVLDVADVGGGRRFFLGGRFETAGDAHAPGIAVLEGNTWRALGGGQGVSGGGVECLHVHDDGSGPALYAGGAILGAGSAAARHVARWNGTQWSSVGPGPGSIVHALATFDEGAGAALYAGSDSGVARWDGAGWSSIGGGGFVRVFALAVFDSGQGPELVAAGNFTQLGGVAARYVAAWNGTSWRELGGGFDDPAWALVVHDDGTGPALYAGGDNDFFHVAGQPAAVGIARWNGTNWSGMAANPVVRVRTLAVHDDGRGPALVVGGFAVGAQSQYVPRVARWSPGAWSVLGGDFGGAGARLRALASIPDASGHALYVGGDFDAVDGRAAGGLAKWNGTHWDPMGPGVSPVWNLWGAVHALAGFHHGPDLAICVGGDFSEAGGRLAEDFAVVVDRTPFVPHVPSGDLPVAAAPVGNPFCTGDGGAAPCPCGNVGASGHGCRNSLVAEGALLGAQGTDSIGGDTLLLTASGIPLGGPVTFFQGTLPANGGLGSAVFDGLVCVDGTIVRIGTKFAAGGRAVYPEAFDVPVSLAGALPPAGGVRHYQAQYRDPNPIFCTPSALNWTNGLTLVWRP